MNPSYQQTVFHSPGVDLPASFCILTAWNPDGQTDQVERNRQRDQNLADKIDALSLPRIPLTGLSPDETHAEPGWAIPCDLIQGLALGREFRQEAIFQVVEGDLFLVHSDTGTRLALGSFDARLRHP